MNSTSPIAAAFAATTFIVSPAIAQAPCTEWNVTGRWFALQTGNHYGYFDIQQSGSQLRGSASAHKGYDGSDDLAQSAVGLDGHIQGATVEITVYWHRNSIGVYSGTIDPTGRIEGTTFDKLNPNNRASWYSSERMYCVAREATAPTPAAPPPPAKKVKVLGKKKLSVNCATGYVWRVARPDDLVCVTPAARQRVAQENQTAASFVDRKGDYGKNSCIIGYVWRDAFDDDGVCVTPEARALAAQENQLGPNRRAR